MKIYSKRELDRWWFNMTIEQRHDRKIWWAFCEAYKTAPDW